MVLLPPLSAPRTGAEATAFEAGRVGVRARGLLLPTQDRTWPEPRAYFSTRHHYIYFEQRWIFNVVKKRQICTSRWTGFHHLLGFPELFMLTHISKYYWHSPCIISLHLPHSPLYYSKFPLLPSINQCVMLLSRISCTEQGAPRVNTVKTEKSVLDMYTTCGLLLSWNEVNWDSIHMDFELHKFWLISFEDWGSERLDFVKDDTQTSYYHI